ncbi:hypothetical protein SAMN05445850_7685 [Paraburkholderia tuberum]|uniref:Uncharacterized protein n=1 Tax=Paraburkholderia tuberum TaxID=157910 RepID=A0A1H1KGA5_9BURK|nr:hypothetical protein SAMN05445850_7685 [Paraburkholderia tuberum]
MSLSGRSLRTLVDKWIGATDGIRVTQFSHGRGEQCRFVRVEGASAESLIALIFFRHDDGSWCVFPPERRRPAMNLGV